VPATTVIQIERAVQERQLAVHESPKIPETQLKKVEKPVETQPKPEVVEETKPVLKPAPKTPPKPKHPIAQAPQFTKPLSPVKADEGQPVTLTVEFEGFPSPQISWYRESFEIRPSNDFQVCSLCCAYCFLLAIKF